MRGEGGRGGDREREGVVWTRPPWRAAARCCNCVIRYAEMAWLCEHHYLVNWRAQLSSDLASASASARSEAQIELFLLGPLFSSKENWCRGQRKRLRL